ncbi:hypothetical protein [Chelativorans sp. M5D2P16]|uniref:hypothetical protein n=1 Tax=Chelativorans sp. M5D2P16 TaxID=3095678 RepID=UPI002ACA4E6D|nr:hypothetical protein [Chelativorans sp. M5D2P16]MDZ5695960.1 hypothetical protein [Chelativorans sp. M5D2P16]
MQETASTETSSEAVKTPPIEKDGSNAPLEPEPRDSTGQQAQDATGPEDREVLVQKDGGTMPLSSSEEDEYGERIATSQQDVEAQQEGEPTAAAEADIDTETTASTSESDFVGTPPIEKDGSTAPLEVEPGDAERQAQDAGRAEDRQDLVQKEGGTMPLASGESDESGEQIATSQQDAEAQQEGEPTAAAEADKPC